MLRNILAGMFASLFLGGCQTMATLEPIKGDSQSLEYEQGTGYLVSNGADSGVVISAAQSTYAVGPRLTFNVLVRNRGEEAFEISESNISAVANGQAVAVVSAQKLHQEAETAAAWATVAVALGGAAQSYNAAQAGTTTYSGTANATATGPGGTVRATGNYSGTAYDHGAAQRAQNDASRQTAANLTAVQAQKEERLGAIGQMLQRTTLRPGSSVQGSIVIDGPKVRSSSSLIELVVSVARDVHRFAFRETPAQ